MEEKKPNTEKDDLLLRLLKDYEEQQLEEQPEKELFPSEDFRLLSGIKAGHQKSKETI